MEDPDATRGPRGHRHLGACLQEQSSEDPRVGLPAPHPLTPWLEVVPSGFWALFSAMGAMGGEWRVRGWGWALYP